MASMLGECPTFPLNKIIKEPLHENTKKYIYYLFFCLNLFDMNSGAIADLPWRDVAVWSQLQMTSWPLMTLCGVCLGRRGIYVISDTILDVDTIESALVSLHSFSVSLIWLTVSFASAVVVEQASHSSAKS